MKESCKSDHTNVHENIRQQMMELFKLEDSRMFELFGKIQRNAQLCETLDYTQTDDIELSGSRWRLMLRLLIEEHLGTTEGITPTELSHSQNVSKNTISALLRGLEVQNLIQRNLDPSDLRVFRIQLTDKGRDLIRKAAPSRVVAINRMFSGLSKEEQLQLLTLLNKLHASLITQAHPQHHNE